MNVPSLNSIKTAFNSKYYTVNESWLQECVDFYIGGHKRTTIDSVLAFIISQWQLCDLREINNVKGCLPNNLAQQKCVTLPGKYILQMDCIYDISTSKYKQLEKIRNVSTENIEVTESENATQFSTQLNTQSGYSWEPKSKRMMHLKLTDGKQEIVAIENKPIPLFDDSQKLLPGFKIMIIGPVTCRRGVILLEEQNISPIGGEVDSLLVPNAIENVLARALKLEENPNPYSNTDSSSVNNLTSTAVNRTNSQNSRVSNSSSYSAKRTNPSSSSSSRLPNCTTNSNKRAKPTTVMTIEDDEFDNIDFSALDEEIERKSQELSISTNPPRTTSNTSNKFSKPNLVVNKPEIKSDSVDDYFELMEIEQSFEWSNPTANSTQKPRESSNFGQKSTHFEFAKPSTSNSRENKTCNQTKTSNVKNAQNSMLSMSSAIGSREVNRKTVDNKSVSKLSLQSITSETDDFKELENTFRHKRSHTAISLPVESNPKKIKCSEETMKNRKISDFIKPISSPSGSKEICQFLCDIEKETFSNVPTKRTIRGKVKQFSKMSIVDSEWCLTGTLTDDTSNIDVDFSSKVLDKLMGFTAQEFQVKKKMNKQNPEMKNILRQDLKTTEEKIFQLDALVELEFVNDKKPTVVKVSELTEDQKKEISKLSSSKKK